MRRLALVSLVVAFAFTAVGSGRSAFAHAAVVRADPAPNSILAQPPSAVTIVFTEPVDDRVSSIRIFDSRGLVLATPAASQVVGGTTLRLELPKLQPGIYNVLYRNVSRVDGHALQGSYPFTVLKPDGTLPDLANTFEGVNLGSDPAPSADGVAVRALALLGLVVAVAGALVSLMMGQADPSTRQPLVAVTYLGCAVLLLATGLNFVTLRDIYGEGVSVPELLFQTRAGGYLLARLGVPLFVAMAASFSVEAPKRSAVAVLGGIGVYLWAFTATSHAAAGAGSVWASAFDLMHGVAAVAWVGAVLGLALAVRVSPRKDGVALLISRIGSMASVLVFVLLVTGIAGALVEFDAAGKLTSTRYGATLLVKLAFVVPLLAVAAVNARRARTWLASGRGRLVIATATAEVVLGLAVFLGAAFLTQTTVAKSVPPEFKVEEFEGTQTVGELSIALRVDPNVVGVNRYRVSLQRQGTPAEVRRVRLVFQSLADPTIGPATLVLNPIEVGVYLEQGFYATVPGPWQIQVEVRRDDAEDAVASFELTPASQPEAAVRSGLAWSNPAPGLSWNQFGGLLFLAVGLGGAIFRRRFAGLARFLRFGARTVTVVGLVVGSTLLFGVHQHAPLPGEVRTNPVPRDAASVAVGRSLYEQNCQSCHGRNGVPPKGLELTPYPLDLTLHVPQHSDGTLYSFISNGVTGTSMRAWSRGDGSLTDVQIWNVVNYLRGLPESAN